MLFASKNERNIKKLLSVNPILLIYHWHRLQKLRFVSSCEIPMHVFDKGLLIWHLSGIIVSKNAKVGKFCGIFQNTTIGIDLKDDRCPIIGDGVTICAGASVLGGIHVADDSLVAANAVVLQGNKNSSVLAGVPAKEIKKEPSWSMHELAKENGLILQGG